MRKLRCPTCTTEINVDVNQAGKIVVCSNGHKIKVPKQFALPPRKKGPSQVTSHDSPLDDDQAEANLMALDLADLERRSKAVAIKTMLVCPKCEAQVSARIVDRRAKIRCPECAEMFGVSNALDAKSLEVRHRGREKSKRAGWESLARGLEHIQWGGTILFGLSISMFAALAPIVIPLIAATSDHNLDDKVDTFVMIHFGIYVSELAFLFFVFRAEDELLSCIENKYIIALLGIGFSVYFLPTLIVKSNELEFNLDLSILLCSIIPLVVIVAALRILWGLCGCFQVPAGHGLKLLLGLTFALATASAIASVCASWIIINTDFRPKPGNPQISIPALAMRLFYLSDLGRQAAHILFVEFLRQVARESRDSIAASYIAKYEVCALLAIVISLGFGWGTSTDTFNGMTVAFLLLGEIMFQMFFFGWFLTVVDAATGAIRSQLLSRFGR